MTEVCYCFQIGWVRRMFTRSSAITARGRSELDRAAKVATFIRKNSEIGAIVIIYIRI